MDFYDLASEGCQFDVAFVRRLGFKEIFLVNRDISATGHGSENALPAGRTIAFGKDIKQLLALVKHGASAVAITDSYIDAKLLEAIEDNGTILCMPMSAITASYGTERARNAYKMSKLFSAARKRRIEVAFVSMAKTRLHMNSCMQLMELAKLIGADERYARHSMAEVNMRLGVT